MSRHPAPAVAALLHLFEDAYAAQPDDEVGNLLFVSFAENLPLRSDGGTVVRAQLGPRLARAADEALGD